MHSRSIKSLVLQARDHCLDPRFALFGGLLADYSDYTGHLQLIVEGLELRVEGAERGRIRTSDAVLDRIATLASCCLKPLSHLSIYLCQDVQDLLV